MPTPGRGRRPGPRVVPARHRRLLGRGRPGLRRPRRPTGRQGAARRRPGPGGGAARRPSGAPTCWWSTTRCSSRACTGSRPPRRRAAPSHTLTRAGCALLTAHTNADQAVGGVSEAMAAALGPHRRRSRWSRPRPRRWTSWSSSCRPAEADRVRDGPRRGRGRPDRRLRPGVVLQRRRGPVPAARRRRPTVGEVGRPEVVDEVRVEVVLPRRLRAAWSPRCWPPTPTRSRPTTSSSSATPAGRADRHRPDRRRRADDAAGVRRTGGGGAAGHRAGRPGRGRPRPRRTPGGAVRRGGRLPARRGPRHRRRRLRHQRPAPPPGVGVPRARRPGAGRRRPLGGGVDLAAGAPGATGRRRWAIRWRSG